MLPTQFHKLETRIFKHFRKGVFEYSLVSNGDKILVGLSGGKDSLCLLEMLARMARIHRPHFEVEAVHIRMDNIKYETDTSYIKSFADEQGVRLHIVNTSFDDTIPTNKPICFLCSWHRRKQMFNLAQELGCNKLALGHHMDDIIHTAMMNEFYQGSFSTMPVSLKMRKMPLTIIRPLCLVTEEDINSYAAERKYQKQIKLCPFERDSQRAFMKDVFRQIEQKNPEVRYSMWNALEKAGKLIEE